MSEMLERELRRAGRADQPLAVMVFDIGHFKQFNDLHGHDASSDVICRYGGEEFVAAFPRHGEEATELLHLADRALYQAKETGRNRTVIAG